MNTYADKSQENESRSTTNRSSQKQSSSESPFQFADNRPEALAQRKLQALANNHHQTKEAVQLQTMAENHSSHQPQVIQKKQGLARPATQMERVPIHDDPALEGEADLVRAKVATQKNFNGGASLQAKSVTTLGGLKSPSVKMRLKQTPSVTHSTKVLQGVFLFTINTDDYTLYNTNYFRVKGKYMTGNSEFKHVTADSVKDNLWTGMEGMPITQFVERLIMIADEYQELPGVDLAHAHKLEEDEDADVVGINGPMRENYKEFSTAWDQMSYYASNLGAFVDTFKKATEKRDKDAIAFHIQNSALELITNLDKFRDLMPLVNVVSGLQKRGNEREAKSFLKDGKATKHIKSEKDALWAFFDFAAIDQLGGNSLNDLEGSIPWLDVTKLKEPVMANTGKAEGALVAQDYIDAVAGVMLANHIRLTRLSYPLQAENSGFGTKVDIVNMLANNHSPVNYNLVADYATGSWDFFK